MGCGQVVATNCVTTRSKLWAPNSDLVKTFFLNAIHMSFQSRFIPEPKTVAVSVYP